MRMIGDGLSKKGRSGTVDDIRRRNDEKREVVGNSGLDDALKRIDPSWGLDVKPTLDFDFVRNEYGVYDGEDIVKGQFIDHATVSRNSVATYFDATGKMRTAGVNEPRFAYDPETGEPMGLLIEEQKTNLILQSENLTSGNWTLAANLTLDADVLVAPDGTLTGDRLTLIGSSGHNVVQSFSQIDGTTYTVSVYAKNVSNFSDFFQIAYYDGPSSVESKTVKITDNWERYSFTFTAQAGVASPQIRLLGFGFGGDGDQVGIWGVQLEVGSFESSYIKTEGSQVTRAADNYTRMFSEEFNSDEFTVVIDFDPLRSPSDTNFRPIMLSDGNTTNRIGTAGNFTIVSVDGVTSLGGLSPSLTAPGRLAISAKEGNIQYWFLGEKASEYIGNTDIKKLTTMLLGHAEANLVGTVPEMLLKRCTLYPISINEVYLKSITS